MVIVISLSIIIVILLIAYIILSFYEFRHNFMVNKKNDKNFYENLKKIQPENYEEIISRSNKFFEENHFESVEAYANDDICLYGELYIPEENCKNKSVILCHDYNSCGKHDFAESVNIYKKLNYNILIIDQRCHGRSQGKYTTHGIMESFDIVTWCKWLEAKFGSQCDIFIHGVSMGSFAAIAACANPEIPVSVKGVIAESIYSGIYRTISSDMRKKYSFLSKPVTKLMNGFFRNNTGFDMRDFNLFSVAKSVKTPVLFIHSEKDRVFKLSSVKKLSEKINAQTEILSVKNSLHLFCFIKDEKNCVEKIKNFVGEM